MNEYIEFKNMQGETVLLHFSTIETVIEHHDYVSIYAGADVHTTGEGLQSIKNMIDSARRASLSESEFE